MVSPLTDVSGGLISRALEFVFNSFRGRSLDDTLRVD